MASIISRDAINGALAELERAVELHDRWAENVYAALVCRMAPDERDMMEDAHRHCHFGQWYYSASDSVLARHRGFAEVEVEHERMHAMAARLMRASVENRPIAPEEHRDFVEAMKRTKLEIQMLRRELEVSLYNIDPLTGIPGRVEMLRRMREQQDLVTRGVNSCAVAMLDVDRFKSVNDNFGHLVGDEVLVALCRHAEENLRTYDQMFRYGGEEFLLCLPDRNADNGKAACERLRVALGALEHRDRNHAQFQVTVSIGIAPLEPGMPIETSIDRADQALLRAKNTGRNRVVSWTEMQKAS